MNDTTFHVAFFSNSSDDAYPENTPSNFRVKLAHPIDLTGKWECALTDLHITNLKNGIRLGYNEIGIYRIVKKKRVPKNGTLPDVFNKPKNTLLLPTNQTSVTGVVEYLNRVTKKYMVSRVDKNFPHGPVVKKRGIFFKYENGKVQIQLNFGYAIHLGSDICRVLGIKNQNIIPNKLGHIVMREGQQYETLPILNDQIYISSEHSTALVCTDLVKNMYFESKTLPLLKAIICESGENLKPFDFHPATFCELAKNHFESINIKILNQATAEIYLRDEPMYFQLEFRKIA